MDINFLGVVREGSCKDGGKTESQDRKATKEQNSHSLITAILYILIHMQNDMRNK